MGLTLTEQETVIRWDRSSDEMTVYTADTFLIERLKSLDAYRLIREYTQGGQVVAADFAADKKLITIRKGRRALTDEQREKLAEQLSKGRAERDEKPFQAEIDT